MNTKLISLKVNNKEINAWDKLAMLATAKRNDGTHVLELKPRRFEKQTKKVFNKKLQRVNIERLIYREQELVFNN